MGHLVICQPLPRHISRRNCTAPPTTLERKRPAPAKTARRCHRRTLPGDLVARHNPSPRCDVALPESACRARASSSKRSISAPYARPLASHSFGYMLMLVKPGMVLISLMNRRSLPIEQQIHRGPGPVEQQGTQPRARACASWVKAGVSRLRG